MISIAIIKAIIIGEAIKAGFNPSIALAVAHIESNYRTHVMGTHGEIGLMQIRPEYSKISGADLLDPRKNAREGIRQLKKLQVKYPESFLCRYNGAGPNCAYEKKVAHAL